MLDGIANTSSLIDTRLLPVVFPFYIRVGEDDRIVATGPSLERIVPGLEATRLGARFGTRPKTVVRLREAAQCVGRTIQLVHENGLVLQGQFYIDRQSLLFLGAPLVDDAAQLQQLGLLASDFAAHDSWSAPRSQRTTAERSNHERAANDELRKKNAELEEIQRQLIDAKEHAEQAAKSTADFLANMSHEIRTPLNAVIGMTSLLSDTPMTAEQQEYVETIRGSGQILLALINDVLDLSKIDAGKLELEITEFDLASAVETAVDLVASQAASKNLRLSAYFGHNVPEAITGDPTRFQQVLVNLLANAVKFTAAGAVTVEVAFLPGPKSRVRVAVTDTGIGIAPDKQSRLFHSFVQADASMTRKYGGTGLGLAISHRLVVAMGGQIGVQSELGHGATFAFDIPCQAGPTPAWRGANPALRYQQVVVIEPQVRARAHLTAMLQEWGVTVAAVDSVTAAQQLPQAKDGAVTWIVSLEDEALKAALSLVTPQRRAIVLASSARRAHWNFAADLPNVTMVAAPVRWRSLINSMLRLAQPAAHPRAKTGEDSSADVPVPLSALRILVAEDNPVNQRVASMLLERLGHTCDMVGDGAEAVAAIDRQHYDIVFLDLQMPNLDGLEVARQVVAKHAEARPYLCAMTANAMREDRERCVAAGMDDFITKPVDRTEIRRAIDAALRAKIDGAADKTGPIRNSSISISTAAWSKSEAVSALNRATESHSPARAIHLLQRRAALIADVGPGVYATVAGMFLQDAPKTMAKLRDAVHEADLRSVERLAHTLRGSALNMGATALASMAEHLERQARAGDLVNGAVVVTRLNVEVADVVAALRDCIETSVTISSGVPVGHMH